jgi:hypothetical protein
MKMEYLPSKTHLLISYCVYYWMCMSVSTVTCCLNAYYAHMNSDGLTSKYCIVATFVILIYVLRTTCIRHLVRTYCHADFTCLASIFRQLWRLTRQINKVFALPPSFNMMFYTSAALTEGECRFCLIKSCIRHVVIYFRKLRWEACRWRLTASPALQTFVRVNLISKIYFSPLFFLWRQVF